MERRAIGHVNALTYEETLRLFRSGRIGVRVDQGLAIVAVRSGLPLSSVGRLAGILMMISPVIGLGLAMFLNWWWAIIGLAVAFGNFRVARAECVKAVREHCLDDVKTFLVFRDRGIISFDDLDG